MHPYPMTIACPKCILILWLLQGADGFSKQFQRLEPQVCSLQWTSTPGLVKWMFHSRCSQAPSLCTSWGQQALRGCRRKEQPTAPSQVISSRRALAPCAGAGKEGTCSKKAAKSQILCWHHLSKKRTCIHRPQCSWFTLTWVRSEPGPGALLQQ